MPQAQIILDDSPTWVSNIPKDEDEEVPYFSSSVGFLNFGFLTVKAIPEVSSDKDDIDEIFIGRVSIENILQATPIKSSPNQFTKRGKVSTRRSRSNVRYEAGLFVYRGLFRVPADVHF